MSLPQPQPTEPTLNIYKSDPTDTTRSRISGLYLGEAFSGKTHNLCTWPNPLVISFDPDNQTARSMPGVWVLEVESWAEFENTIMQYVRARALGRLVKERAGLTEEPLIETLGVDTISVASIKLGQEIQGSKDRLTIPDYGVILNKMLSTVVQCVETTKARKPGEATYNVIFNAHLTTETNDEGAVISVSPAVGGQFKKHLPRMFGFCFLCEQSIETTITNGKAVQTERRFVRTVPKTNAYVGGDRLGGKGNLKKLPVTTGGTYPELCEAWGIKP